jgi:hypothetical protein
VCFFFVGGQNCFVINSHLPWWKNSLKWKCREKNGVVSTACDCELARINQNVMFTAARVEVKFSEMCVHSNVNRCLLPSFVILVEYEGKSSSRRGKFYL